jgi:hypothetical protein
LLVQRFFGKDGKLRRLKEEAELAGLHININKTKGMKFNTSNIQKFAGPSGRAVYGVSLQPLAC